MQNSLAIQNESIRGLVDAILANPTAYEIVKRKLQVLDSSKLEAVIKGLNKKNIPVLGTGPVQSSQEFE